MVRCTKAITKMTCDTGKEFANLPPGPYTKEIGEMISRVAMEYYTRGRLRLLKADLTRE